MIITSSYDLPISGYASLFGVQDVSGDVVRKGAFSASLLKLGGAPLPMLFGHETVTPIGVWDRMVEDATGLFVQGLLLRAPKGRRHIRRLVEAGALSGLSIGYWGRAVVESYLVPYWQKRHAYSFAFPAITESSL